LGQDEILGLKPSSPRKRRPDSEQQLAHKRDHRPLHYHAATRASSRTRFSEGAPGNFSQFQSGLSSTLKYALNLATKENWQGGDAFYSSLYTVAPRQVLFGYGHEDALEPSPKHAIGIGGRTRTYVRDEARRCPSSRVGGDLPLMAVAL
jgi:hypothetical protein